MDIDYIFHQISSLFSSIFPETTKLTFFLQISTLLAAICTLIINIVFYRTENTKTHILETITKQRNYDMLKMREISAKICMLTDKALLDKKIKEEKYLETLILESKKIDFLLKRQYDEDREVIAIKDKLINYVVNYCNNKIDVGQIMKYNKLFSRISELYIYAGWQCIKRQAKGKINTTTTFKKLHKKFRYRYLSIEDDIASKIINQTYFMNGTPE